MLIVVVSVSLQVIWHGLAIFTYCEETVSLSNLPSSACESWCVDDTDPFVLYCSEGLAAKLQQMIN